MVQECNRRVLASLIEQSIGLDLQLGAYGLDIRYRRCAGRQRAAVSKKDRDVSKLKVLPKSTDEGIVRAVRIS